MTVSFAPRFASRWAPPTGLSVRGSVIVLPGRGGHGEVYERLARRLAAAAYEVVALDALPTTALAELTDVVGALERPAGPLVLLGAGSGALEALQIAATAGELVQAVVVAGPPAQAVAGGHQFTGPVLVLHGSADRITPLEHARDLVTALPQGQLTVVEGGRHDVLNGLQHDSVARQIVHFLDWVRVSAAAQTTIRRKP